MFYQARLDLGEVFAVGHRTVLEGAISDDDGTPLDDGHEFRIVVSLLGAGNAFLTAAESSPEELLV
jgi:hypothetical protein